MRASIRSGAALVALTAITIVRSAQADCRADVDCKGDRICESGVCVDPKPKASSEPAPAPTPAPAPSAPAPTAPAPTAAPPEPPKFVTVSFEAAAAGDSFKVASRGEQCSVPCSLHLEPGSASVDVSGDARYSLPIDVVGSPGEQPSMKVKLTKASAGRYVAGGIVLGLATTLGILAIVTAVNYPDCDPYYGAAFDACKSDRDKETIKLALSVPLAAVGIPMGMAFLFSGNRKPSVERVASARAPLRLSFAPFKSPSGGGAMISGQF